MPQYRLDLVHRVQAGLHQAGRHSDLQEDEGGADAVDERAGGVGDELVFADEVISQADAPGAGAYAGKCGQCLRSTRLVEIEQKHDLVGTSTVGAIDTRDRTAVLPGAMWLTQGSELLTR